MLSMIQTIILSYIKEYNTIHLSDIREAVNEPVNLLANEIVSLYNNKYFEKIGNTLIVTDKALYEDINEWNTWIEDKNDEDGFFSDDDLDLEKNEHGYPIFNTGKEIGEILKLQHININSYHIYDVVSKDRIRKITAPSKNLKARQRWILKQILNKYPLRECVHGFVKSKSIVTNASCHTNMKEIGCIDIKNFFQSINEQMVCMVFDKLGYNQEVAKKLTLLCTYEGVLPQGAPTSPMLANIVLEKFDAEMQEYTNKYSLSYSRYADDLTLSGNCDISIHIDIMKKLIEKMGLSVNEEKTHIMRNNYRKMVTGLIVTDVVKVPRQYKKKFRQEIYYCNKYGVEQHLKNIGRTTAVNFKEYMYGKAYYIHMVEQDIGEIFLSQLDDIFSVEY